MILNEFGNLGNLAVIEDPTVFNHRITIALDEELDGTTLSKFAVAGMDMHALHYTKGCEI